MPEDSTAAFFRYLTPSGRNKILVIGCAPKSIERIYSEWGSIDKIENTEEITALTFNDLNVDLVFVVNIGSVELLKNICEKLAQGNMPYMLLIKGNIYGRIKYIIGNNYSEYAGLSMNKSNFPSLWVRDGIQCLPWKYYSPRGRIERPILRIYSLLERFHIKKKGWSLILKNSTTELASIVKIITGQNDDLGRFWYKTKTDTLIIFYFGSSGKIIIKIPLNEKAERSILAHSEKLKLLRKTLHCKIIEKTLPESRVEQYVGKTITVEKILQGESAFLSLPRHGRLKKVMSLAIKMLGEWQESQLNRKVVDKEYFEKFWKKPLEPLQQLLTSHDLKFYQLLIDILEKKVLGVEIPMVPIHGDYWLNNILWEPARSKITGILDWDHSDSKGLPLLDVFHMLYWRTNYLYELYSIQCLNQTLKRGFSGFRGEIIDTYCKKLKIQSNLVTVFFCRYWLGDVASRLDDFMDNSKIDTVIIYIYDWLRSDK